MIKQRWNALSSLGYLNSIILFLKLVLHKLRIISLRNDSLFNQYSNLVFLEKHNIKYKKENCESILCNGNDSKSQSPALLRLSDSDVFVFHQIYISKEYKPLVQIYQSHFGMQPKVIIDAGANIGLTATYLASHFPSAQIICLEPDESNFNQLKRNIELCNHAHFHLIQKSLWSSDRDLSIHRNFRDKQSWSLQVAPASQNQSFVSGISVSSLIKHFEIEQIDIFKIDIEGAEGEIFKDRKIALSFLSLVKTIALEIHEDIVEKLPIEQVLMDAGFKLFRAGESIFGVNEHHFKPE